MVNKVKFCLQHVCLYERTFRTITIQMQYVCIACKVHICSTFTEPVCTSITALPTGSAR